MLVLVNIFVSMRVVPLGAIVRLAVVPASRVAPHHRILGAAHLSARETHFRGALAIINDTSSVRDEVENSPMMSMVRM